MKKKLLFTAILMLFGQNIYSMYPGQNMDMVRQPRKFKSYTSTDPKVRKEIVKCSKDIPLTGNNNEIMSHNWDESCVESLKEKYPDKIEESW